MEQIYTGNLESPEDTLALLARLRTVILSLIDRITQLEAENATLQDKLQLLQVQAGTMAIWIPAMKHLAESAGGKE